MSLSSPQKLRETVTSSRDKLSNSTAGGDSTDDLLEHPPTPPAFDSHTSGSGNYAESPTLAGLDEADSGGHGALRSKNEQHLRQVMEFTSKVTTASAQDPRMSLEAVLDSLGFVRDLGSDSDEDEDGVGIARSTSGGSSYSFNFGSEFGSSSVSSFIGGGLRQGLTNVLTRFSSTLAARSYIENNPHMLSREQQEARKSGWKPKKQEQLQLQQTLIPWRGEAAVCFLDLSGYSKVAAALTDQGGAHALSTAVNLYFESLLGIVQSFGGDVVTFAGDAVLIVWPTSSVRTPLEVCVGACTCALELQRRAGTSAVSGTNLSFQIHIAITYGEIESEIFKSTSTQNNNGAYQFVSGQPLNTIGRLLELASSGQCVVSQHVYDIVKKVVVCETMTTASSGVVGSVLNVDGTFGGGDSQNQSPLLSHRSSAVGSTSSGSGNQLLTASLSREGSGVIPAGASSNAIYASSSSVSPHRSGGGKSYVSHEQKQSTVYLLKSIDDEGRDILEHQPVDLTILRSPWLERNLVPDSITAKLKQGFKPSHIAEMRTLAVLFVRKAVNEVSTEAWFAEVSAILDECRCPIVQILGDDKGVHIIAAAGLYRSEASIGNVGIQCARKLQEKETGSNVGCAVGETFVGITGSDYASRWDLSGPAVIRAARLMQYADQKNLPVCIDESVSKFTDDDSQLQAIGFIRVKGAQEPVKIYNLVARAVSVTAGIQCIEWSSPSLHIHHRNKLRDELLFKKYQRGISLISGPVGSGKKTLATLVFQQFQVNSITHIATREKAPLRVVATIADWFSHHLDPELADLGTRCRQQLDNGRVTKTLALLHIAIAKFIEHGHQLVVVVGAANLLDRSSIDFIKSVISATPTSGSGRFLFVVTTYFLWGYPSPSDLESEFSRPLKENTRLQLSVHQQQQQQDAEDAIGSRSFSSRQATTDTLEPATATNGEKEVNGDGDEMTSYNEKIQTELVHIKVSYPSDASEFADAMRGVTYFLLRPHTAEVLLECLGGCLMLIRPVVDLIRTKYIGLMRAGGGKIDISEAFMPATASGEIYMTNAGEDYFSTQIDWRKVAPRATARFTELYDVLPPRLQLVLRVVASLCTSTGSISIRPVAKLMLKLNSKLTDERIYSDIALLMEAQILKTPKKDDGEEVTFAVPAMIDCVVSLLTPEQDKLLKRYSWRLSSQFLETDAKQVVDKNWFPVLNSFIAKIARSAGDIDKYRVLMKRSWKSALETNANGENEEVFRRVEERIQSENRRYPQDLPQSLFSDFKQQPRFTDVLTEHEKRFKQQQPLSPLMAWCTAYKGPFSLGAISYEYQFIIWIIANYVLDFKKDPEVEIIEQFFREHVMKVDVDKMMEITQEFDETVPIGVEESTGECGVKPLESAVRERPHVGEDQVFDEFVPFKTMKEEKLFLLRITSPPETYEEALKHLAEFRAYHFKVLCPRRDRAVLFQRNITSVDLIPNTNIVNEQNQCPLSRAYMRFVKEYPLSVVDCHRALMDLATAGWTLPTIQFNVNLQLIRDSVLREHTASIDDFKSFLYFVKTQGGIVSDRSNVMKIMQEYEFKKLEMKQ